MRGQWQSSRQTSSLMGYRDLQRNFIWMSCSCPLFFSSLENGNQVKISKNLDLSSLPQNKALSMVGIFTILAKSSFFPTEISNMKLSITPLSWIFSKFLHLTWGRRSLFHNRTILVNCPRKGKWNLEFNRKVQS